MASARTHVRVATYGCPYCTMRCGIAILDDEGRESELDYENVGLLGSNLDSSTSAGRLAQLPVRRLRARHDLGGQRPRVLRRRHRAGRRRRATSGSATPRPSRSSSGRSPTGRATSATCWRRDAAGRPAIRPWVRGLRDAGQGPGDLRLQLQVHPGHGARLRGQPDGRPPQGIVDHHLRGQADRARVIRARQGPEGDRPAAAARRDVRIDRHVPVPVGRAGLRRGALSPRTSTR